MCILLFLNYFVISYCNLPLYLVKLNYKLRRGTKKVRTFGQPRKSEGKRMVKMKIFKVYLDDGRDVFKIRIPAFDEKQAIAYCEGNGEIVAIKEEIEFPGVSNEWLQDKLSQTDMTPEEQCLIDRIIRNCGLGC